MWYLYVYFLGLCTLLFAAKIHKSLKDDKLKHVYICPEEDCYFVIRSANLSMVNEAVIFHWGEHPTDRR